MAYHGPFPVTFSGVTDEILVSGINFSGGVTNTGTVSGGGIVVVSSTLLPGGIVNTKVVSGTRTGISISASTIQGAIVDSGVILAPIAGILVNSAVVSGGIKVGTNGAITANGTGGNAIEVENTPTFGGGISNSGKISARQTGIFVGGHAASGGSVTLEMFSGGSGTTARYQRAVAAASSSAP